MVILYRVNPLTWHGVGRWLVDTRTFTLPNLIACGGPGRSSGEHIVREFVPWLGGRNVSPIVAELASLIEKPQKRQAQSAALRQVVSKFAGHSAGKEAAAAIAAMLAPTPADPGPPTPDPSVY
jgi:lipid A disaccharide synthetase